MHAFSTLMGVILAHDWAAKLVVEAQRLVTYFRSSHRAGQTLRDTAKSMGINTFLATSNQTRMTSTYLCLDSISKLEAPLRVMPALHQRDSHPNGLITKREVLDTIQSTTFWGSLTVILQVLRPFEQIITAIQGHDSTLADVSRYLLYVARTLEEVLPDLKACNSGAHGDCLQAGHAWQGLVLLCNHLTLPVHQLTSHCHMHGCCRLRKAHFVGLQH